MCVVSCSPQRGTTNMQWAQAQMLSGVLLVSSLMPLHTNSLRNTDRSIKER